jgi:hypothetical protein
MKPRLLAVALPRKHVSSWLRRRGCGNYGYLNTEALQSANQRPLELLGVTSVEVIRSKIAIGLLILEHVEHDDQNCVTHGHDGALLPLRAANRRNCAGKYVFLLCEAAHAAWHRLRRNHTLPFLAFPLRRLPALSLFPGQRPAPLARCWAEGKRSSINRSQPPGRR